jgi:acetylornithine deacetylase/succinyl-diaminopimelate desuccinylase-like protein
MSGGYQGPGMKTVIPAQAQAKISCRLVPHQDPRDIQEKIERHLKSHCPPGVHLEFYASEGGVPAYNITPDHLGLRLARQVLENLYQKSPLQVRIGATLPIADAFKRYLGADTVFFSFSTADEDYHAPNEFFRLNRLEEGLRAWAEYLRQLGGVGNEP